MKKFEAMYYPYASVHNKETLKLSSLYFDRIHVLSPVGFLTGEKSEDLHRGNEIYEGLNKENILIPHYEILMEMKYSKPWGESEKEKKEREEREGIIARRKWERERREKEEYEKKSKSEKVIISEINPAEIYKKYFPEFLDSIKDDLNDENFKTLKHDKKWLLFYEKVRPFMYDFKEKITWHGRDDMLVDADLGESILLNHAIFASMDKKLTPFTDELEHSRLLNHKMHRNFELMKDYLLEEGYIDDIKQNLLAKKVLEINLSGVEGVSYSDILDFRDDNKKELKSFRIEMGRISTSISSKPWTPEFESEIAQIVKSEIEPKVQDLENQSSEFKDNMLAKYGNKAIPVAITLGAIAYAGVPLSLAVVGTTLFDKFVKGDDSIIESIFNDWKDWRHQNRNSLSYLMNFNKLVS